MARAIGATAISRVIRSSSMRRSTSSRSNRRCSRTVAPADAAASRLSSPRMCDGGVATWNRSSRAEPERRAPVRGGQPDRAVGVAHRLGQSGRARAEHEHRLVGRRAPPRRRPGACSARSTTDAADGRRRGRSPGPRPGARPAGPTAVAVGHGVDRVRSARARGSTSVAFHAGLSSTGGRAELADGVDGDDELGPVGRHHGHPVTRSDAPGDRGGGPKALAGPSSSANDQRSLARQDGVAVAEAARRPARAPRASGPRSSETFFSDLRSSVNIVKM